MANRSLKWSITATCKGGLCALAKGVTIRYGVVVDDEPVLSAVFAEEVMRWIAGEMHEEPGKPPTTRQCSMEHAYRCRDTQNAGCQFPECRTRKAAGALQHLRDRYIFLALCVAFSFGNRSPLCGGPYGGAS
jgi:hypothetical protein